MRTKGPRASQGVRTKRKTVQEVRTDSRIWPLLERYCKLAKVKLIARGADLYDMKLPVAERAHFGERASVRVALSLEALERDPDAKWRCSAARSWRICSRRSAPGRAGCR